MSKKSKGSGADYEVGYAKPPKATQFKKGQSGNPKGRPRKRLKEYPNRSDIQAFGNTLIEVRTKEGVDLIDRRTALLHKIYKDAMRGKPSMQRFLYKEFERNDVGLAALRLRHQNLMTEWVINNENLDGIDGESIPLDIQLEIARLETTLSHYYPTQYSKHRMVDGMDEMD